MPYIETTDRPTYDRIAAELLETALIQNDNWVAALQGFVYAALTKVFGDSDNTRYFRINEAIGVLACASLEWIRRLEQGDLLVIEYSFNKGSAKTLKNYPDNLMQALVDAVPVDDGTLRAGHLNYFLTRCMIEACRARLMSPEEVPTFFGALMHRFYHGVGGPYEDKAIEKNGDVYPPLEELC